MIYNLRCSILREDCCIILIALAKNENPFKGWNGFPTKRIDF